MFRSRRVLIIISAVVVGLFTWCFCGISGLAHAAHVSYKESQAQKMNGPKPQSPEEKFEVAVKQIETVLADSKRGVDDKKKELKALKKNIDQWDKEIRANFSETEKKLKNAKLPPEIMQRHYDFVKFYEDNLKVVQHDLGSLEPPKFSLFATKKDEIETIRNKTKALRTRSEKKIKTFDPNNLPHRTRNLPRKEPRLKKEDFEKDFAPQKAAQGKANPILVAANGPLSGILPLQTDISTSTPNILLAQANTPPTAADLAETIEVKFTPDIVAKAAELNHDPVKIYNWVRNNIEFVPTWGSIQGAQYCLETMQGNAFDISSLLIALLRASGIHARYVMGTIEVPIDQVMNWVGGFTDPKAALDFMASGGIPVKALIDGGVIKYGRLEHIWVAAYIDYIPSRGAKHKISQGDTWIDLDASFKQYEYTKDVDLASAVPFDTKAFIDEVKASGTINKVEGWVTGLDQNLVQNSLDAYKVKFENYMNEHYSNATIGDLFGYKDIIVKKYSYFLGTLPHKISIRANNFTEIPEVVRHKLTFEVKKDGFDDAPLLITKSLPELAGKKVTLSFEAATQQDGEVLLSFLPKDHPDGSPIKPEEIPISLPAYLINMKPILKIDENTVEIGSSAKLGSKEIFTMTFYDPAFVDAPIVNDVNVGECLGISLNVAKISQKQMDNLKSKMNVTKQNLENKQYEKLVGDEIISDLLYMTAVTYLNEVRNNAFLATKSSGVKNIILPSEAIFSANLDVLTFMDLPRSVEFAGFAMDADRLTFVVKDPNGDKKSELSYMLNLGFRFSELEHSVPESLLSTADFPIEGLSAVKALNIANNSNIPIYKITAANLNAIMPQLVIDASVKSNIANAVASGKEVIVSKTNINFYDKQGCGYIIFDPNTGGGSYMISTGKNGADVKVLKFVANMALSIAMFIAWNAQMIMASMFFIMNPIFVMMIVAMFALLVLSFIALYIASAQESLTEGVGTFSWALLAISLGEQLGGGPIGILVHLVCMALEVLIGGHAFYQKNIKIYVSNGFKCEYPVLDMV